MIGWLAKVLIMRFGGSRIYTNAKPFFIGIILFLGTLIVGTIKGRVKKP